MLFCNLKRKDFQWEACECLQNQQFDMLAIVFHCYELRLIIPNGDHLSFRNFFCHFSDLWLESFPLEIKFSLILLFISSVSPLETHTSLLWVSRLWEYISPTFMYVWTHWPMFSIILKNRLWLHGLWNIFDLESCQQVCFVLHFLWSCHAYSTLLGSWEG